MPFMWAPPATRGTKLPFNPGPAEAAAGATSVAATGAMVGGAEWTGAGTTGPLLAGSLTADVPEPGPLVTDGAEAAVAANGGTVTSAAEAPANRLDKSPKETALTTAERVE